MTRASYAELGDACATAHAMELIGPRWTYPILRELMLGPRRFTELLASVPGCTPAVLTSRLRDLTQAGLIVSLEDVGTPGRRHDYQLTQWGEDLGPLLRALGRWGLRSPTRAQTGSLTPDATVQMMMTVAGGAPDKRPHRMQLELLRPATGKAGAAAYNLTWTRTGLTAQRQLCTHPSATVRSDLNLWNAILSGAAVLTDDRVQLTGDRSVVTSLVQSCRSTLIV